MKTVRVGTDDVVGAVVLSVNWDSIVFEKDGKTYRLDIEMDSDYHSMCGCECGGCCGPGYSSAYFIADEIVE